MELLWSSRSPFARKVTIALHELGIADRVALRRVVVASKSCNADVMALNPLNQIPTLLLDDGTALFDSLVIVDHLNTHFAGALIPDAPADRTRTLRLHALGDGLMRLNVLRLAEDNRGEHASPEHAGAMAAKTAAVLDLLETEASSLVPLTVGSIAVASGLAHLDFRFPNDAWRENRPNLAAWHGEFSGRPSMTATRPEDVY